MSRYYIVEGDATTHGGTVLPGGDPHLVVNGKHVVGIGHMVACPKCKGVFPIVTGAPNTIGTDGQLRARHDDETACGAKLISSQRWFCWTGTGAPESRPIKKRGEHSDICIECLLKAAAARAPFALR